MRLAALVWLIGIAIMLIRGDWHDCGPYACTPAMWEQAALVGSVLVGAGLVGLLGWLASQEGGK